MVDSHEGVHAPVARWATGVPAFLVGVDQKFGKSRITVHATRAAMSRGQARQIKRQLRQEGVFLECRVKRYQGFGVQSSRTLEEFLEPFTHDYILYDATGAFQRASKIVRFAGAMRDAFGKRVVSLYWQQGAGRLHTVLDRRRFPAEPGARDTEIARTSVKIRKTVIETCGTEASEFVRGVRIGFALPREPALPIDAPSLKFAYH